MGGGGWSLGVSGLGYAPVSQAEVAVVGQRVLIWSLPSDGGPGATTHLTAESDTLADVTCDVTQREEDLGGHWRTER